MRVETTNREKEKQEDVAEEGVEEGRGGEAAKPFSGRRRTNNAIPVLHAAAADMQCKSLQLSLWEEAHCYV